MVRIESLYNFFLSNNKTHTWFTVSKSCFTKIKYNEMFSYLAGVKTTMKDILLSYSQKNKYYTLPDDPSTFLEGVFCLIQAMLSK